MMKAPERIYLQTGLESWDDDPELTWDGLEEVTWCVDRINDNDVEYVRRDIAAKLWAALNQKLAYPFGAPVLMGGHRLLGKTAWLREESET